MMIALHKNARTTPAIRAEIAASADSIVALARRYGISEQTVSKWKKRSSVHDASHTPHRLQTTLTPAQERIVVELRRTLLLPLDDLLAVTREFICPKATRSGLDRCLRRHGVGNLNALQPAPPTSASKPFKAYEPGYLHIDLKYLPQMQDESSRRYLFVAIDRATRWVFVQVKKNKTAASAKAFLNAVHKACPMRIQKVLTDNGKEFTDRLFATRAKQPSGEHEFDQLCASLGIEHRLTKPRTPRTNGMVERFNGRIADVLRSHRFQTGEDLEQTLLRYVALYNHQFPQSALKSRTPIQAMKDWYAERVDLFVRRPCNQTGLDSYRREQTVASAKPEALPRLPFNLLKQFLRGEPGSGVLLRTKRFKIYPVATCDIGWTADVIVVVRTVFVDRVMCVLGQIRSDQPGEVHPLPASLQVPVVVILDELEHGVRVATLSCKGQPMLGV